MAISYLGRGNIVYSAAAGAQVLLNVPVPATVVDGDLVLMVIGIKPSVANSGTVGDRLNLWEPVTNGSLTGAGGYGTTLGADTGNTSVFVFETSYGGLLPFVENDVSLSNADVAWGVCLHFRNATGVWGVAGAVGQDTTAGAAVSIATSPALALRPGDELVGAMVIPTDVTTPSQFTAQAFAAAGITFTGVTELLEADSSVGADIGGFVYYGEVATGTATSAVTLTATASGTTTNVRGPGVVVRLREDIGPVQSLQASGIESEIAFGTGMAITPFGPSRTITLSGIPSAVAYGDVRVAGKTIRYVTASAVTYSGPSANTTVTIPTQALPDDLLLIVMGRKAETPLSYMSDFVTVADLQYGGPVATDGGTPSLAVFVRRAMGGDAGRVVTITQEATDVAWAQVLVYRPLVPLTAVGIYTLSKWVVTQTLVPGPQAIPFGNNEALDDRRTTLVPYISEALMAQTQDWAGYSNPPLVPGDEVLFVGVVPTDAATPTQFSAYSTDVYPGYSGIQTSNVVFQPVVELSEPDTTLGTDLGGFVARTAVSSGYGPLQHNLNLTNASSVASMPLMAAAISLHVVKLLSINPFDAEDDTFGSLSVQVVSRNTSAFFALF